MSTHLLPHEIVETADKVDACVIWLHGLGASGHDFVPIVPQLQLPADLGVRFIFPHAPQRPVTINGGFVMPAWYDILEMSFERKIDDAQIQESANAVMDFVEAQIEAGIAGERIILAGFSQGGAVCYHAALSCNKKLAGLMTMSTYFATNKSLDFAAENKALPIHISHGTFDAMVPVAMGQHAKAVLEEKGYTPEYQVYPMDHEVCPAQIRELSRWIQARLC